MPNSTHGPAAGHCQVIAHRGASGYLPEHTLAAYALAIRQGADYIEPDLVMTADGELIARHDNRLETSTDVAARPEYAARRCAKVIAGERREGWFSEDFTLAEIRQLYARECQPARRPHGTRYDGLFRIPTLQDIIDLVWRLERETGRVVGLCPEIKEPTYFAAQGLDLPATLLSQLQANGYGEPGSPVWLQCFDADVLRVLHRETGLRLMQLLDTAAPQAALSPAGLTEIARYAAAIGPNGAMLHDGRLVGDAHQSGLQVFPWGLEDDGEQALHTVMRQGVDGLFTDFPDRALSVRASLTA